MIDDVLTMIPGPTPVHRRILARMAEPTVSHQYPPFVKEYSECLDKYRRIMEFDDGQPFICAGGGTLAMEMALVNCMAPDDKLLIVNHGYFGDRFAQIADAFDFDYDVISADWGHAVDPAQLAGQLKKGAYTAVTITHVDTSTGVCSPVADYAEVLQGRDELVILDGVCASAGEREACSELGIDVVFTGPQKAFGAPPGLAMLVAGQRAMEKRKSLTTCRSYYADLMRWLPIMENPGGYFSTSAVNEIRALNTACDIILEEGLSQRYRRHEALAQGLRAGASALGLILFTSPNALGNTLSVLRYPEGIDDGAFRSQMADNGVVIAGALGPIAGKAFRVGHMGNIGAEECVKTLTAMEKSLAKAGLDIEPGITLVAAGPHLHW